LSAKDIWIGKSASLLDEKFQRLVSVPHQRRELDAAKKREHRKDNRVKLFAATAMGSSSGLGVHRGTLVLATLALVPIEQDRILTLRETASFICDVTSFLLSQFEFAWATRNLVCHRTCGRVSV